MVEVDWLKFDRKGASPALRHENENRMNAMLLVLSDDANATNYSAGLLGNAFKDYLIQDNLAVIPPNPSGDST